MYADDIVMLAEDEGSMRSMIGRFEGYLEKKRVRVKCKEIEDNEIQERRG